MKIFGREPAALVGVVEAILAVALSFGLFHLTQTRVADIIAVVTAVLGVVTAYFTRDTMLGVLVGLAKSVLVLGAAYGLTLTDAQTGALIALVTLAAGFWQRSKTTPAAIPSLRETPTPTRTEAGHADVLLGLVIFVAVLLALLVAQLLAGHIH